jgi:uncharacterized paraquat-inducible protein A
MSLGWKVLLPVTLLYVMVVAVALWAFDELGLEWGPGYALAMFAVNVVLIVLVFWGLDRNRLVWGQRLQREGRA